jgi:flagellar biosynthesis GTPase FlhF
MKKKLEAELISIAHRILKLKNKSDLVQLHQETRNLYEKLSVLRFVEEHLGDVKPTIGQSEIEEKITAAFETVSEESKTEAPQSEAHEEKTPEITEEVVKAEAETETGPEAETETAEVPEEPTAEEEQVEEPAEEAEAEPVQAEDPTEEAEAEQEPITEYDQPAETAWEEPAHETAAEANKEAVLAEEKSFKPAFELSFDPKPTENETIKEDAKGEYKNANSQITFEDILGSSYVDPVFVKPEDLERERETKPTDNVIPISRNFGDAPVISINKEERGYTLNDRLSKGITIGLNDRVAFMKHLFNNSSEDYNRVLSQLMTFDTFDEAKNFIDTMVKPDYNDWEDKDEYATRFLEIVEKRFS